MGPVVGGWLTYNYGWQWIFYINIPLGFLSSYITWICLKDRDSVRKKLPIDTIGLLLLILSVTALQIALDKGNEWDWFSSSAILSLFVTFFVSGTIFTLWNGYSPTPLIKFDYFKVRNYSVGTFLITLGFLLYFGATVLVPIWLQNDMGYTPLLAGLAVMSIGIGPVLTSILVGRWMERIDLRYLVTASFLIFAATFYWYTVIDTNTDFWDIAIPRFWQGFSISLFFMPLVKIILSEIPQEELAGASGVFNFLRILFGGGIGTSLSVTFFDRRGTLFHSDVAAKVTAARPETLQFYQTLENYGIPHHQATGILNDLVTQQGDTIAIINYFWLSALLFILAAPLVWLCKPVRTLPKKAQP